ncbi:MAG: transglycosylase SLT domain-containing protein [Pseudomonadota bacterium]
MKKLLGILLLIFVANLLINSCTTTTSPPDNPENICHIFVQYPKWYRDTAQTQQKWGVPISVQMAIMYYESSFRANARPSREKILFVIPWKHPTSAYGYSQALNSTWDDYQKAAKRKVSRKNFADASDFIGWYANQAKKSAGISPSDAYHLYLAYHEGISNYKKKSYAKKDWLIDRAKQVKSLAAIYQQQLSKCEARLRK